jgi:hypothetical protein
MATTTNYGWTTPDNTALVKDGASAIRTLGSSIDTTLKAQIDAQIPDTLLTTTGDVIYASAANTPARLGIGTTGQVLQVSGGLPSWQNAPAANPTTASAEVLTSQSTTSTSYTDLTTAGPAVTLTTSTSVLVIVSAFINPALSDNTGYMSYAISGATTTAASDNWAVAFRKGGNDTVNAQLSYASVATVTAGSNTFTSKYRVTVTNSSPFANRRIFVMRLN